MAEIPLIGRAASPGLAIGDLLVSSGLLSREDLDQAIAQRVGEMPASGDGTRRRFTQRSRRLVITGDMALADAGALRDPGVVGSHRLADATRWRHDRRWLDRRRDRALTVAFPWRDASCLR